MAGRGGGGAPSAPAVVAAAPSQRVAASSGPGVPRVPLGVPYAHDREEGTDGLMGGLAFGLPGDTPLVRRERLNRFTIDDVQLAASRPIATPPWVRRTGGAPALPVSQYVR